MHSLPMLAKVLCSAALKCQRLPQLAIEFRRVWKDTSPAGGEEQQ